MADATELPPFRPLPQKAPDVEMRTVTTGLALLSAPNSTEKDALSSCCGVRVVVAAATRRIKSSCPCCSCPCCCCCCCCCCCGGGGGCCCCCWLLQCMYDMLNATCTLAGTAGSAELMGHTNSRPPASVTSTTSDTTRASLPGTLHCKHADVTSKRSVSAVPFKAKGEAAYTITSPSDDSCMGESQEMRA